jgi:alcohol dehydrogenase (NADP+)
MESTETKGGFAIAEKGVDPKAIPTRTLYTGAKMPAIGLGTFGSDHISPETMANAVRTAVSLGYRHIDCASVYGNEGHIGHILKEIFDSGLIKREDLWITSKLWNDMHGNGDVICSCSKTLKDLNLEYLDLYLTHWPFPNHHPPGCPVETRSPGAQAYIHENFMKTWTQMEHLVESGLVRHIGTSNMTVAKLRLLLRDAFIKPACNEMELHPHFQQAGLFGYVTSNGICPVGYCPLGSPQRPLRDRTPQDTVDTNDPVIIKIAAHHGISEAAVCLKWAFQRGHVIIPLSTSRTHLLENIRCITSGPLTREEMTEISVIDKNCRLVKGHVFLWKDNQSWEDLWDVNGEITPP